MTDPPALSVVVVAYGSPELLELCLEALGSGLPVLVIDNSSRADVHDVVAKHGHRYADAGSNLGFAAGVNRALGELGPAHGDVLLLNPDAQVTSQVARALQHRMRAAGRERVACVSPRLTRGDGSTERVEWPFPTPWRAWLEAVGLGRLRREPGFLIGAVLLLRSEAIDEIGPFDERFFLYAEETDWQRRASNAGYSVLACNELIATHTGAGTSTNIDRREAMFHAASERYIRRWFGTTGWWIWRTGAIVGAAVRCVTGPDRDRQRLRLVAYLRGPERFERATGRPT